MQFDKIPKTPKFVLYFGVFRSYNKAVLRKPDGESGPECKLRVCFLLVTSASTSKIPCSEKRPTPQQELGPGLWRFDSFLLPRAKRIAKFDTVVF